MGDWGGIDLGDDGMDLNLSYSEPPPPEPKATIKSTRKSTNNLKSGPKVPASAIPSKKEFDLTTNPFKINKTHVKKKSNATSTSKESTTAASTTSTIGDDDAASRKFPASTSIKEKDQVENDRVKDNNDDSKVTSNVDSFQHVDKKGPLLSSASASASTPKSKYVSISSGEDPNQYHAKPSDLSKNALKRPRPLLSSSSTSIFSKIEFSSLELDSRLVKVLESSEKEGGFGLNRATNVQSAVVPILSKRCNMLIRSQTGSGKTFSFLLPMVNNLMNVKPQLQRSSGTRALIVSPTRELCHQIEEVLLKLTTKACCYCVPGAISGGEKKKSEKARLRKGIVILVSTPGRLLDHLNTTESFNLNNLNWIVLDEADRLLDMGFEQSVLEILSIIRGVRLPGLKEETIQRRMKEPSSGQLLDLNYTFKQKTAQRAKISSYSITHVMASATLSKNILKLAAPVLGINRFAIVDADRKTVDEFNSPEEMLNSDIFTGDTGGRNGVVSFDSDDEDDNVKSKKSRGLEDGENIGKSVETLSQYYMMVTCKWRLAALCSFLKQHRNKKVVVFFSTCDSVDFHSMLFRQASWPNQLDAEIPGAGGQQQMQDNEGEMEVTTAGSRTTSATRQQLRFQMGIAAETEFIEPLGSSSIPLFADESSRLYRLHGNVVQKDRQAIYKEFSNAKRGVLFCTDVAARGLDMPNVDWILQYDPPCDTTDYVHRVGRTARRGLSGQSLIFLLPSEASYIQLLSSHSLVPEPLSLQSLLMDASAHIPGSNKFKNIEEMTAVILQRRMERITLSNKFLTGAARQAFRSYVRAYATHGSDTKSIFRVQLLHLGHVAKSFALRENPAALRNQEDIIAKISNGEYSQEKMTMVLDKVEKKAIRDKKYGLAAKNGKKNGSDGAKKSSSKSSSLSNHTNKRTSFVEAKPNVSTSLSSSLPAHLQNLSSTSNKGYSEKQALRKMSKKATPTVSGKFRNAGGSYFKKRLKSQMISEFSA